MTRIGKEIITTHHRISRSYTVQQSCKQIIAPDYTDFTDREKLFSAPFIFLPGFPDPFWVGTGSRGLPQRVAEALYCHRNGKEMPVKAA